MTNNEILKDEVYEEIQESFFEYMSKYLPKNSQGADATHTGHPNFNKICDLRNKIVDLIVEDEMIYRQAKGVSNE